MILDPTQLQKNIARLECGSEIGTAFLVGEDKAITAFHCLDDYSQTNDIKLYFLNINDEPIIVKAKPLQKELAIELDLDIVVLQLESSILGFENLRFSDNIISNNAEWETFGYPGIEKNDGMPLYGNIRQIKSKYNTDSFDLILEYNGITFNTMGLSGAPLVIDGIVKGIITYDRDKRNTLGAISTIKMKPLLTQVSNAFFVEEENHNEIEIVENHTTEFKIKENIQNNDKGYIFVKGVPGSGKTTLAQNLKFDDENIEVINKYFLKEVNEVYNIQYKASEETFGKWFVNSISNFLYDSFIEDKAYSYKDIIKMSSDYFFNISNEVRMHKKKYVFIIDGIDEVLNISKEKLDLFLGILPQDLSKNIFIIIFGNNENNIPIYLRNSLDENMIVGISPLEHVNVINFIKDNLKYKKLEHSVINKIAHKSEGNPLYLRYLISYLENFPDEINEEFINTIPAFNGEIVNYYKIYWDKIKSKRELVKLLAILARVRNQISRKNLMEMFPADERFVVDDYLSIVDHLLDQSADDIYIYHNSFSDFIRKETAAMEDYVHQVISKFCLDNTTKRFSLENILYHLINAELDLKKEAVKRCNQEWLDCCSIENVHPESMIVDMKNVLDFAIDDGEISEIIRILLLLQRLKFRNEKLFRSFSIEMARALYEIGKEKYILNYIIREDSLIESVSNADAIYLLRKFVKDGFAKESNKLFEAIRNRCIKEYESNKGFDISTLFLDIKSVVLFPEYNPLRRLDIFNRLLTEANVQNKDEIIQWLSGEIQAWLMKEKEVYGDINTLKKMFGTEIDKRSIDVIIKILLSYIDPQNNTFIKEDNQAVLKAVKDLEFLLLEYKVTKKSDAIEALIQFSKNTNLLETLIENEEKVEFDLRESNGVDFNYKEFLSYKNYWIAIGYSEKLQTLPEISTIQNWENFLHSVIKTTSIILGKCYRSKAELEIEKLEAIHVEITKLLNSLNIDLKERVKWDRSYFIPEHLLPLIYKEITFIYLNFFSEKIEELESHILNSYQLGLYNEGYRRTLFAIANEIVKYKGKERKAYPFIQELESFTDKYILNRWERNRDFLEIVELYGKIGSIEIANRVFKKMLDTSMGPSWYKESQLTLMGTGVKHLNSLPKKDIYMKEILGHLDYASGEMTFQRYVRDDKEEFVGILSKVLGHKKSLEYFKRLTFPNSELLLNNAMKDTPDVVDKFYGYTQGTNEINLQDAMISFIKELDNSDILLKYALTEIFIQGDERYFDEFTELQLEILHFARLNSFTEYQLLIERVKRQFVVELDNERRSLYIRFLEKSSLKETVNSIMEELKILDVFRQPSEQENFFESLKGEEKESKSINLAKEELKYGNNTKAKEILANRLSQINDDIGDVFYYSNESTECLNLLKKNCESSQELIKLLKPILLRTGIFDWQLANNLIKLTGDKLSETASILTMKEVLTHVRLMIDTPKETIDQFKWVENEVDDESYEIEKFIIWLTNLPDGLIYRKRAIEVLAWLGQVKPHTIIPLLIEEALENNEESSEISSNILHVLSQTNNVEAIWYCICLNENFKNRILQKKHFIIKSCFLEIVRVAHENNLLGASDFIQDIEKNFFNNEKCTLMRELDLDKYSNLIIPGLDYFIKTVNEVVHLDESFMESVVKNLSETISPLDINNFKKIDEILERSYSIPNGLSQVYRNKVKFVMNLAISDYVTQNNYNKLKKLFRKYNPYFSERKFSYEIPSIHEKVTDIFEERSKEFENAIFDNGKLILHFNEIVSKKEERRGRRIEVVSFLIDSKRETPVLGEKLYDYFTSNLLPKESSINMDGFNGVFPLILKSSYGHCRTSWYTPSEIHPAAKEKYIIPNDMVQKKVWKSGTILDVDGFGMPLSEGCLLTVDRSIISKFGDNYRLMHLVKYNDGEKIMIIDYLRKRIHGG